MMAVEIVSEGLHGVEVRHAYLDSGTDKTGMNTEMDTYAERL